MIDAFLRLLWLISLALPLWIIRRQRQLASHLIDGRTITIVCQAKSPQASRWTQGKFTIDSESWTWEPQRGELGTLPTDLRARNVRDQIRREVPSLFLRALIIECASSEGDFLIAALPGQVEHLYMALTTTQHNEVDRS